MTAHKGVSWGSNGLRNISSVILGIFILMMAGVSAASAAEIKELGTGYSPAICEQKVVCTGAGGGIYVYDLEDGQRQDVGFSDAYHPAISGDKLAWLSGERGEYKIQIYDLPTGKSLYATADVETASRPRIEGETVVWRSGRLCTYDLESGVQKSLDILDGESIDVSGDKIAYTYSTAPGKNAAAVFDMNTGRTVAMPYEGLLSSARICGDRIVVYDAATGKGNLILYDLASGEITEITAAAASGCGGDAYTFDIAGDKIAYVKLRDDCKGKAGLYVYDIADAKAEMISTLGDIEGTVPSISGDRVVWGDAASGKIYVCDLSGGESESHPEDPASEEFACDILSLKEDDCRRNTEPVELKGEVRGGEPPYDYAWMIDGVEDSTLPEAAIRLSPGKHTVRLTVRDAAGRTAQSTSISFLVYTRMIAIIPAKFSDSKELVPMNTLRERADLTMEYLWKQSYGEEHVAYRLFTNEASADGWFPIPYTQNQFNATFPPAWDRENMGDYAQRHTMWMKGCEQAGISLEEGKDAEGVYYDTAVVLFPLDFRSEATPSSVRLSAVATYGVWAHELGHSLYDLVDKAGLRNHAGHVGYWGLMGFGYKNPAPPIIGLEKQQAGWLDYQDIRARDIDMYGREYPVYYLDDFQLHESGLLRLEMPSGQDAKYVIFEGRRAGENNLMDPSFPVNSPLFQNPTRGILVYEVREEDGAEKIFSLQILGVGESMEFEGCNLQATCMQDGENLKIRIGLKDSPLAALKEGETMRPANPDASRLA